MECIGVPRGSILRVTVRDVTLNAGGLTLAPGSRQPIIPVLNRADATSSEVAQSRQMPGFVSRNS